MKQLLTTIAAVVLVGCGESDHQHSHDHGHSHAESDGHGRDKELKAAETVAETATPEPPTAKAPDISIHDAAYYEGLEAVKQHLAAGTDVNAKDEDGVTPLHYAAYRGRKEIAELLIEKGADVNAKEEDGGTPLDLVIKINPEIADLLRKHGGKTGEELKAEGNPAEPDAEAKKPEPPTAKAPDISIHYAAYMENIEAVRQHLAAGTDVNALNEYGNTALDVAHPRLAELLRKHGAKTAEELKAESK